MHLEVYSEQISNKILLTFSNKSIEIIFIVLFVILGLKSVLKLK
jgi:hypothetical protein